VLGSLSAANYLQAYQLAVCLAADLASRFLPCATHPLDPPPFPFPFPLLPPPPRDHIGPALPLQPPVWSGLLPAPPPGRARARPARGPRVSHKRARACYTVCCLLSAVCCLLSAVCCLLFATCCLVSGVCCLLCCLLSTVCCLLSAVCCLLSAFVVSQWCACAATCPSVSCLRSSRHRSWSVLTPSVHLHTQAQYGWFYCVWSGHSLRRGAIHPRAKLM
jgi:hypothetical protein